MRAGPPLCALRELLLKWTPFLELANLPTLPQRKGRTDHGDDLLTYAKQLREYLTPERRAGSRMSDEQAQTFFAAMDPLVARAEDLSMRSKERNAKRVAELAAARVAAKAFDDAISAYRRTLRALVGRGHPDVRAITRSRRSRGRVEEVGEAVSAVAPVVESADVVVEAEVEAA